MSNKKRLKRIEAMLTLLLELNGATEVQMKSIPGGGIKPPKKDDDENDETGG